MNDYSLIVQQGRLVRDPELNYTQTGATVCTFDIASNDGYGEKEHTSFHQVVVFGKQAENCNTYLTKGKPVIVQGRLKQQRWKSQEGQTRSKHVIEAGLVQFLYTGKKEDQQQNSGYSQVNNPFEDDDDIQF